MPSLRHLLSLTLLLTAALAHAAGCSATKSNTLTGTSGGATVTTSGAGGDLLSVAASGAGGGDSSCFKCSADLHSVVDCDGNVLKECPPEQGCAPGGTCTTPCEAATANKSTLGCEFYSVVPGQQVETRGSCFAALVANTWTSPITITAHYGDMPLDAASISRIPQGSGNAISYQPLPNGQLPPGEIAIVFLARSPSGDVYFVDCPAGTTAGWNAPFQLDGTGRGKAFRIATSAPIVAYDIYPYGGKESFVSSATLLIPTPAWDTNYVAADAFETTPFLVPYGGSPHVQIVGSANGTTVTINPAKAIVGGNGVAASGANQPVTYDLQQGEVIQLMQPERLAGSTIQSDKPIGVWGGTGCMNIPLGVAACDSGHQQLAPVRALGNEYVGVRHGNRGPSNEAVPFTLVGAVDGTQLTYEPSVPQGAPSVLNNGQVAVFNSDAPFVVRSQDVDHPFYLSSHMTGGQAVFDNFNGDGDPEYVNVIPPAQWLPKYLFLTDPTYGNTELVFTRQKGKDGFADVTLKCLGTVSGWQPADASGNFEYARVKLVAAGAPQGGCNNGANTAESSIPFGLTVWGWDPYVSYGYPAGMSVEPINEVVIPPTPK